MDVHLFTCTCFQYLLGPIDLGVAVTWYHMIFLHEWNIDNLKCNEIEQGASYISPPLWSLPRRLPPGSLTPGVSVGCHKIPQSGHLNNTHLISQFWSLECTVKVLANSFPLQASLLVDGGLADGHVFAVSSHRGVGQALWCLQGDLVILWDQGPTLGSSINLNYFLTLNTVTLEDRVSSCKFGWGRAQFSPQRPSSV